VQYSASGRICNDWHLVHLGSRALGGAGLIITEATAVNPVGRISPSDIGLWKDDLIDGLKRINDFIHRYGSASGVSLLMPEGKPLLLNPGMAAGNLTKNMEAGKRWHPPLLLFRIITGPLWKWI
jgi:2,4-dienoyl-CoA reductase-like NADH-dependent reductase (Old Yellow Enzyme family)